jgi:enediyne biosynthesis protein E4
MAMIVGSCSSAQTATTGSSEPANTRNTVGPGDEHGNDQVSDSELTCWTSPQTDGPGPIEFSDITSQVGLVEPLTGIYGHAAAFGDPNGDGFADLVVGTFADRPIEEYQQRGADGPNPDRLLLSRPDLELVDGWSTELARTSGAVFADFDGDGDDDLLLIRHAGHDDLLIPSRLFENTGSGTWGAGEPVPLPEGFYGRTPAVADYDGDGDLDVYVAEDRYGSHGGVLLENRGGLEFTDVTEGSGLEGEFALGATAGDVDGDGMPDLVTSTAIHLNTGSMHFEDVTPDGYVPEPVGIEDDPAGVALGDLDRDGLVDIVVGQHYRATVEFGSEIPIHVFHNEGTGVFVDITDASGITPLPTLAPHVAIADIDNDGWPDIVTSASAADGKTIAVYHSVGEGELAFEVSSGLGSDQYWVGAPVVDLDRDGRLDVLALEWEPSLPSIMFHNEGSSGHWLEVSIEGPGRGVGSVVTVRTPDGALIGTQEIGVGGGYASGHQPIAHFGLGPAMAVDVTISSASGDTTLANVAADQHLRWPGGCR